MRAKEFLENYVNETAAVGIVTAQNTTADVGPNTLAQNIKKLFPNIGKKTKRKND